MFFFIKNNYYVSCFFWSTFQKIINAIVGFISVPLLLGLYGKADYGILGIATACNGYMHLLDLGMDVGSVKYYSQWRNEGKVELISRVARTNISFYAIIAFVNIIGLVSLAFWGESFFSIGHNQFYLLRSCLLIIALFCVFSWGSTTFNQLLIADMQMAFTMQIQSAIAVLKAFLICSVFIFHISLQQYFFLLTAIVAMTIFPYAIRCRKKNLIDCLRPAFYWKDFKIVFLFSLSIFALSLFQMTALQSRPIILSIFATNGADSVAEYKIIEMIPQLIIMIGGVFSSIFLPKASAMVASGNQTDISTFAYRWTRYTTIIINTLTIPFILGSAEILSAYVGNEYKSLSVWLILWCFTVLIQMHTTPGNALVLAYGKTKLLVITTAISCILSILLNIILAPLYGVGAAIISYFLYVVVVIGLYYLGYYKKILNLSRIRMFYSFAKPTLISLILLYVVSQINIPYCFFYIGNEKVTYLFVFVFKVLIWFIPYCLLLFGFKVIRLNEFKKNGDLQL